MYKIIPVLSESLLLVLGSEPWERRGQDDEVIHKVTKPDSFHRPHPEVPPLKRRNRTGDKASAHMHGSKLTKPTERSL